MNRRAMLRATGAALGGAGATAAVVAGTSESAGAQTALTLDVAGDSATVGVAEAVTALRLACDVEWAVALPDGVSPETTIVELAAGVDETQVVASSESAQLFAEADGSESFDVDLIESGAVSADAITPSGGTRETTIDVEARLFVEASDGTVLAREVASDQATVTIDAESVNADEYGSVGGSGGLTIETE